MYALISYEAFKPHSYGCNGWVSKVLGHHSVGMSVHYTTMQVSGVNRIARYGREPSEDFVPSTLLPTPR
jgi:hypothetical protein